MKNIKRKFISLCFLPLLISGCNKKIASDYDPINKNEIDVATNNFDYDGNFIPPEIVIDGDDNDEAWTGPFVSETLNFTNEANTISVKLFRGDHSLFFFFRVTDEYICSKGNDNGDDVSRSDSVEIYIDSLNDGGTTPQTDDYQINLGVHDKTRILVGSGTNWSNWNGLCQYETKINGTLNNNSDIDVGYAVEGMIPWNQIGCQKGSSFGVAFGNVDKKTTDALEEITWNGLVFDGILVEPQMPDNYITYSGNKFSSRGIVTKNVLVRGTVTNENNLPIQGAIVKVGETQYVTDANGKYSIPECDPSIPVDLTVSYSGYITHKYTIHSTDLILSNGLFNYDVKLLPGSGEDEPTPNYVYIGETSKKLLHVLTLSSSRHDKNGLNIQITIDDSKFDKYQQYELYIDTGASSRTLTDDQSWCITFFEDIVTSISSDPKGKAEKHLNTLVEFSVTGNTYDLYVPYALLGIDKNTVVGYSFGIWDTMIKDWEPMNREGEFILVEDPSLYIRQNPDGSIIEDTTGYAEEYDFASDTSPYVNLGTFSGKTVSYVTFSTITAQINHTDASALYVQFTTNKPEWRKEEIIELFIDSGDRSRTVRDASSYMMSISTSHGKIKEFKSYTNPETPLNKGNITVYMDKIHMLVKIPYTALSPSLTQSVLLGFTFGVFNNYAHDWDGYAYNDQFVDPAIPNQYVRVDMNNVIQ